MVCPILKIFWCWCWIVAFLDNASLFLIFNACYKFIPHRIIPLTARQESSLPRKDMGIFLSRTFTFPSSRERWIQPNGRKKLVTLLERTWIKKIPLKNSRQDVKALTNYCLPFKRLLWLLNACFVGKLSELSIYLLRMFWFIIWTKLKMCTPVILYPTNTVSFFVFKLNWCFANLKLFNMWNELIL